MRSAGGVPIYGACDARFARVHEAFRENFAQHGEIGAAVTVMLEGHAVVDVWGGFRDIARSDAWREDTLVNVFSVGKGVSMLAVLACVERGELAFDARVADYWPEFAAADKREITVRQLLAHQAGLPAIREPLPPGAGLDIPRMVEALERQAPWWPPGEAHGYHPNTFGYLIGELVRRASDRTIGRALARDVAAVLDADVYLGLPESQFPRVAEFALPLGAAWYPEPRSELELMRRNAYENPPDISGRGLLHRREWRCIELPHANLHATARGIARVYAALAAGGAHGGRRIADAELLREATREHSAGLDRVLDRQSRFGLGFQLTQPERPLGPNARSFGHFGAGGSLGFCDPDAGLALGYVMNDLGPRWQNPRNRALLDSVYACLV